MKPRFKTIRSAASLVYGRLNLSRTFRSVHGWGIHRERLAAIITSEGQIVSHMIDLERWSRKHRRLNDGRTAVVDDYLIAHNSEIHSALVALTEAVDELARQRTLSTEQRAILEEYRVALQAAWSLDLLESEESEIQRTGPPVEPSAPEPPSSLRADLESLSTDQLALLVSMMRLLKAELKQDTTTPVGNVYHCRQTPPTTEPLPPASELIDALDSWLGG